MAGPAYACTVPVGDCWFVQTIWSAGTWWAAYRLYGAPSNQYSMLQVVFVVPGSAVAVERMVHAHVYPVSAQGVRVTLTSSLSAAVRGVATHEVVMVLALVLRSKE